MLTQRLIRSLALTSLFTLSMVFAHIVGGGELTTNVFAPALLLLTSAVIFFKSPKDFSGPTLAAILLCFQLAGHLCFSMPDSDIRMTMAHAFALLLSFQLVRHFEQLISRLEIYITQPITFHSINLVKVELADFIEYVWCKKLEILGAHLFERAPPYSATS